MEKSVNVPHSSCLRGDAALIISVHFPSAFFFFGLSSWTDSPGRTAAKGLDEPPLSHPEMELLLLCLSLWILQYNSAKTDSIIHIGKHQNKTIK